MINNLAVQLYSLRNYGSFEEQLKVVSNAGYTAVETVGTHDLSQTDMQALLDQYNLKICSSHVALGELESNLDFQMAFNKSLGNDVLVLPYLGDADRPSSAAAWQALGERIGKLAQACASKGMSLLYHNHDFEMQVFEGKTALEHFFEGGGSDLGVELDLGWVARASRDPIEFAEKFSGRVARVHVKDIAPAGENADQDGWADVGHGTLDWASILPAVKKAGAEWFVVEHDLPKDPKQTIERSMAFLKEQDF